MKKRILQLCAVAALGLVTTVSGQTVLIDFEDGGFGTQEFGYAFENFSDNAIVANPVSDAVNSSTMVYTTTFDGMSPGADGIGFGHSSVTFTRDVNGAFFSVQFRADNNPTGDMQVLFQIAKDGGATLEVPGVNYTKTDGSWEELYFDTSSLGALTDPLDRIQVVLPVSAKVCNIDNIIQYTMDPSPPLSNDNFNVNGELSLYVNNSTKSLEIKKPLSQLNIIDMAGRVVKTIDASEVKSVSLSDLSGFFVIADAKLEKTLKFAL